MLAVGGHQVVGVAERLGGADDGGLLADAEVEEAADLGLGVHLAGALLEAADEEHLLEDGEAGLLVRQAVLDLAEADLLEAYYVLGALTAVPALAVSALPGTVSRLGGIARSHWPGEYPSIAGFNSHFPRLGGWHHVPRFASEPPAGAPRKAPGGAAGQPRTVVACKPAAVPPAEPGGNTDPNTGRNSQDDLLGSVLRSPDEPHALRLRSGQGGSGLLEAIVAVEELVADGDGRNAPHATRVRLSGGVSQLVLDRLRLDGLEDGVRDGARRRRRR